jgi:hypothetical protein
LITADEAKRNCMRVAECGEKAWGINCGLMNKKRMEGAADGGTDKIQDIPPMHQTTYWQHAHNLNH